MGRIIFMPLLKWSCVMVTMEEFLIGGETSSMIVMAARTTGSILEVRLAGPRGNSALCGSSLPLDVFGHSYRSYMLMTQRFTQAPVIHKCTEQR